MNQNCPSSRDLLRLADGELTHNRANLLAAHLATCLRCQSERSSMDLLFADLRAPLHGAIPTDSRVDRVMAAIRRGETLPRPTRLRSFLIAGGGAVVLAASIALALNLPRRTGADAAFQARGGEGRSLERLVGVRVHAPLGNPLTEGATVSASAPFTASYRNVEEQPVYLMLFAVDARGDVHWLYPGYTEANSDPVSVHLARARAETPLSETVVLHDPALGQLRLLTVLSHEPHRVSEIEARSSEELQREALLRLWPRAVIHECTINLKREAL